MSYQSDLVDSIVSIINAAPDTTWRPGGYTVGTADSDYVEARPALDPDLMFESGQDGLYIIPSVTLYNRASSRGRQKIVQLHKGPSVAVCLALKFQGKDTEGIDVANWNEVKKVLDLREDIDKYLLTYQWDYNIEDILAEPPQEIPLKHRWFLSVTEIQFEGFACSV